MGEPALLCTEPTALKGLPAVSTSRKAHIVAMDESPPEWVTVGADSEPAVLFQKISSRLVVLPLPATLLVQSAGMEESTLSLV